MTVEVEVDKEMRIPKGSKGELVTEMLGTVKMNLLLNDKTNEFFQPGDTFARNNQQWFDGGSRRKVGSKWNSFFPKWIPFFNH